MKLAMEGYSIARFGHLNSGAEYPIATCLCLMPPGRILDVATAGRPLLAEWLLTTEAGATATVVKPIFAGYGDMPEEHLNGFASPQDARTVDVQSQHPDFFPPRRHLLKPEIVFDQSLLLQSLRATSGAAIHLLGDVTSIKVGPSGVRLHVGIESVAADRLLIASEPNGIGVPVEFAADLLAGKSLDRIAAVAAEQYSNINLAQHRSGSFARVKDSLKKQFSVDDYPTGPDVYCCYNWRHDNVVWLSSIAYPAVSMRFGEMTANLLGSKGCGEPTSFLSDAALHSVFNSMHLDSATIPWPA